MKTIKELADEIGVSKTAVRKKIANLGLLEKLQTNGNQFVVDNKQETLIKSAFIKKANRKPQTKKTANQVSENSETLQLVSDLVSTLKEQLQEKDKQIEEQQRSIKELTTALENTTASLKTSQALHIGTMQQSFMNNSLENKEKEESKTIISEDKKKWFEFWK